MFQNRQKILKLAHDLTQKCEQNNIWYSLTDNTLLGAVRHGGFVPWSIKFEIMITYQGFNRLRTLYPMQIIDSFRHSTYKNLMALWVNKNDYEKWEKATTFLEIHILVPTTLKKLHSYKSSFATLINVLKRQKNNVNFAIEKLLERHHYQGYIELVNRKQDINFYWHQSLNEKNTLITMNNFTFQASIDYHRILKNKFGIDYMKAEVPSSWEEHISPIKKVKV